MIPNSAGGVMLLASAGAPILKIPKPGKPRPIPRRIETMPLIYRARTLDRYSQEGDGSITDVYGVANVPIDINGNLAPMNNVLVENDPNHPAVRWYAPKVGQAEAGFHFTDGDRFGIGVRRHTGEYMKMILLYDPGYDTVGLKAGTNNVLEWTWSSGPLYSAEVYVTELGFTAKYHQRSGINCDVRYTLDGLFGTGTDDWWNVKRQANNQTVFRVPKPWYLEEVDGEWVPRDKVPFVKQRISDSASGQHRWVIRMPAPSVDEWWR